MKSFRHFSVCMFIIALVGSSLIYTSCKNKCGGIVCQDGGSCNANVCVCPQGYSGNACQTGWSTAAVGTYTCTRGSCVPAEAAIPSWQSVVTKDATNGGYTIDISNFDGSYVNVVAIVDSAVDSVQSVRIDGGTNGLGINATGTVRVTNTRTTINLNFTTYNGVAGSECSMTMVKE